MFYTYLKSIICMHVKYNMRPIVNGAKHINLSITIE